MKPINPESSNITQMADIFVVLPAQSILADWLLFMLIVSGLIILLMFFFAWFRAPLVKLERYLKQGRLSPREAAHCLAQLTAADNKKINKKIDQLRFQRQPPDSNDLLSLIAEVKHDR